MAEHLPSSPLKICGISLMVERLPSKQQVRVRFPYSAFEFSKFYRASRGREFDSRHSHQKQSGFASCDGISKNIVAHHALYFSGQTEVSRFENSGYSLVVE